MIPDASNPQDLLQALAEACQPFGEVWKLRFLCRRRASGEIVAFIHMNGDLNRAARAVGGVVSGYETICRVGAVPEGFRCQGRRDGKLVESTCHACQARLDAPSTLMSSPAVMSNRFARNFHEPQASQA